ncbi:glycosyl transferase [Mesorhizobium sp. IMUNJ 23232]|uniref:glycosyl transferase n=1 Tax=Mesorhizobium sp. IMUNJ 23232 TaxID=3376064 RepID=UPI0037BC8C97
MGSRRGRIGMKKQIICINWGTKYGPVYINRLYGMVARNITPPFTFTCFTDNDQGVRPEVRCEPLPPLNAELPKHSRGIWGKARLWNAELADLEGPVLFLDLDLLVTGSLDDFFSRGDPDDVILAVNPVRPLERLGQTSIYRFPVGKLLPLLKAFEADSLGIAARYEFEQRFVTRNAPGGIKFWPRAWVRLFRHDLIPAFPRNYFEAPRLPRDAKVVLFAGHLNPPEAVSGRWTKRSEARSPAQHIAATFSGQRRESVVRHLGHYFRPAGWIAEHWRE